MTKELRRNMVFDLNCKVSIDYGDGKDFTAAVIIFKNDKGKHIILSSVDNTTAVGEEIIKELSNMGKLATSNESSKSNECGNCNYCKYADECDDSEVEKIPEKSNRKKLGDLTLREVIELRDAPCPELYCRECRKNYSAIHAICVANIDYDSEFLDLEQEVEIGDE